VVAYVIIVTAFNAKRPHAHVATGGGFLAATGPHHWSTTSIGG
jgi:hypothetical protein